MKNPWTSKPLIICATPVVVALLQVIILGYSTEFSASLLQKNINDTVTLAALFLPLIAIPVLWAAVGGLKTKAPRAWYVAGTALNAAYCLLLLVPIQTIAMMVKSGGVT
jgi:ABC-type uncharacterized transport system fused permease/ATPase subunit